MNKTKNTMILFQIKDSEKKRLQEIANIKEISLSMLIRDHLKNLTLEPNKK
jgi:predicted ArsR family transcriptional regulator